MLRTILIGALIAGTITGIVFTAIQQFQVTPLIIEAETYEAPAAEHAHSHDQGAHEHKDTHNSPTNSPALFNENNQRLLFSLLANVLAGIGFALVIASAITFSNQKGWRKGLLWGAAGFMVFFAAPSLGLHPKLPGTAGAPLLHQQLWWIATAAATAGGLAMLVFSRQMLFRGSGILLLAIPHIIGAPLPEQAYASVPELLAEKFVIASAIANIIFWLILGALSGYLLSKSSDAGDAGPQT